MIQPRVLAIIGLGSIMSAVMLYVQRIEVIPEQSELQTVSGTVEHCERGQRADGFSTLEIRVRGEDGLHIISQRDLRSRFPELNSLKPGRRLLAQVETQQGARRLPRYWDLISDGEHVLRYEDVRSLVNDRNEVTADIARWTAGAGACFLILGLALWWFTPKASPGQPDISNPKPYSVV